MKVYELGEKLHFHANFRGTHYLGRGWSAPEANHCWSDGEAAEIILHFRSLSINRLILRVKCAAYLANGYREKLDVEVHVNGSRWCTWLISEMAWHETVVPRNLIIGDLLAVTFRIANPMSPLQHAISSDTRFLGIDIDTLVISEDIDITSPGMKLIGQGLDLIGDVYKSSYAFYRAVKHENVIAFENLNEGRVLDSLTKRNLIPEHRVQRVVNRKYSYLATVATGTYIFPANYPLLMLRDAAQVWVSINQYLLTCSIDSIYGLSDGHYGNFVEFDNATPKWCDIGSITNISEALDFGIFEFIKCFAIPLVMLNLPNDIRLNIRHLMHQNPQGISNTKAIAFFGEQFALWGIDENTSYANRQEALDKLQMLIDKIDFRHQKGFWSDYRNEEALISAWNGKLLEFDQDSRFKAVMDLVKRSDATTFIDIGCNDGIFSLLCLREGLKGIAIDLDEHAINKLYSFVRQRPGIELTIAYGGFLDVAHVADVVLALALTHHLALSQKLTFSAIAEKLAQITTFAVVTEFMPNGLGGTPQHPAPSPNPLPDEYSLENFVCELKKYFSTVEIIPYSRRTDTPYYSNRVLIYCEMKVKNHQASFALRKHDQIWKTTIPANAALFFRRLVNGFC
jgi:hypothetical protein